MTRYVTKMLSLTDRYRFYEWAESNCIPLFVKDYCNRETTVTFKTDAPVSEEYLQLWALRELKDHETFLSVREQK